MHIYIYIYVYMYMYTYKSKIYCAPGASRAERGRGGRVSRSLPAGACSAPHASCCLGFRFRIFPAMSVEGLGYRAYEIEIMALHLEFMALGMEYKLWL